MSSDTGEETPKEVIKKIKDDLKSNFDSTNSLITVLNTVMPKEDLIKQIDYDPDATVQYSCELINSTYTEIRHRVEQLGKVILKKLKNMILFDGLRESIQAAIAADALEVTHNNWADAAYIAAEVIDLVFAAGTITAFAGSVVIFLVLDLLHDSLALLVGKFLALGIGACGLLIPSSAIAIGLPLWRSVGVTDQRKADILKPYTDSFTKFDPASKKYDAMIATAIEILTQTQDEKKNEKEWEKEDENHIRKESDEKKNDANSDEDNKKEKKKKCLIA